MHIDSTSIEAYMVENAETPTQSKKSYVNNKIHVILSLVHKHLKFIICTWIFRK